VLRRTDDFDPFDAPTASDDAAAAFGAPEAHIANEVTGDDLFEGGGGFTSAAPLVESTPVLAAPVPVAAAVRVAASAKAATFATDETDAIKCERRACARSLRERESERAREKMRFFLIIALKTDRYFGFALLGGAACGAVAVCSAWQEQHNKHLDEKLRAESDALAAARDAAHDAYDKLVRARYAACQRRRP